MSDSAFSRNIDCPSCGSLKRAAVYSDGHVHCHKCGHHTSSSDPETPIPSKKPSRLLTDIEHKSLPARKLTQPTCEYWDYGASEYKGENVQVASYRGSDGRVVAQKLRTADKEFRWLGDHSAVGLYGRWLPSARDGGKMLVITEGEIDAMSVSQVQGHKWPVVSVPDGAQSAVRAITQAIDWLEKFERVVFMFDMDEPGQKAAAECAALLSPGKAYIAALPLKDANEMLKAQRGPEILDAAWGAKAFRPDGIVAGTDIWERICDTKTFESIRYPWEGLNRLTRGCRPGELVVFAAGTSVGKSEVLRQITEYFHDTHSETIGLVMLEESVQRTALGMMGLNMGRRLHMEPGDLQAPDVKKAFQKSIGSGRYFLYDHWGSLEGDHLLQRIRYMVRGLGCKTVVLDHISIVVSGIETSDERRTIDQLMTKLRSLVEELQFRLLIVTHLRRVDDDPHEDGGRVSLAHFRGSGSIAQLANIAIGLERNVSSGSNKLVARVLKNRFSGETGWACNLEFDPATGKISESVKQEEPKEEKEEDF